MEQTQSKGNLNHIQTTMAILIISTTGLLSAVEAHRTAASTWMSFSSSLSICILLMAMVIMVVETGHYIVMQWRLGRSIKAKEALQRIALEGQRCRCENLKHDGLCCAVCREHPRSVVMKPCRHVSVCRPCSAKLAAAGRMRCPLCRADVDETDEVFL